MSAPELYAWGMWEQIYGPVLLHERIDYGLSMVAYTVARALGATKETTMSRFLPPWLQELAREERVRAGFERLRALVGVPMPEA